MLSAFLSNINFTGILRLRKSQTIIVYSDFVNILNKEEFDLNKEFQAKIRVEMDIDMQGNNKDNNILGNYENNLLSIALNKNIPPNTLDKNISPSILNKNTPQQINIVNKLFSLLQYYLKSVDTKLEIVEYIISF